MNIQLIIGMMAEALSGNNARIMVQIDNKCYEQTIGNAAALAKHPMYYYMNNGEPKQRISFLKWMQELINTSNIKERTKLNHRNTLRHLTLFKTDFTFDDVDKNFIREFDKYLEQTGAKINTICKHMATLHAYVVKAMGEELINKDPFIAYHRNTEKTHKEFLTEQEVYLLLHIVNTLTNPFEYSSIMGFLFSCFTGLRYSDVIRVTKKNFKMENGVTWLEMKIKKTEQNIKIPVSELFGGAAMLLIDKTKTDNEPLFPLPENCVANKNIQRVMKRVGITKHISFHCGRVTAATLLLEKNVPLTTIQHILGHASVTTTEIYAKTSDAIMVKSLR